MPPRIYLPILALIAVLFLGVMGWLVRIGFQTGGSVFGAGVSGQAGAQTAAPPAVSVEGGGPPPAVMTQIAALRRRIARNPKDDVALTELGDMYLAAGKNRQAIPLYRKALMANPQNVAAKEGLSEAQSALRAQ